MALIKYGGGITQMSGSIAGNTFARNRFGNYVRPRTKPVNPNSVSQALMRNCMAFLTEYWHSTLNATERGSWNTYAAAVGMKNRLGEAVKLTGFNMFVRSNSLNKMIGAAVIEPGPTVPALPETDPTFAVVANVSDQTISLYYDVALPWWIEAGARFLAFMGRPQLATRNFFNGPWKYSGYSYTSQTSPHKVPAPFTVVLGQKIWVYARIHRADARLSNPFVASCLGTA